MRKLIALLLFLLVSISLAWAQPNMVPNGSFEYYSSCPTNSSQIGLTGWSDYSNTPDYFNSCHSSSNMVVGVPANHRGSETPADGNGYVGGVFYSPRENFTRAITPLTPGQSYEVSLSVSLADDSRYAIDGIGVYFFDNGPTYVAPGPILTPQVNYSSYGPITTKIGWVRLTGYFIADSAYDNIVIGNFKSNSSLTVVTLTGNTFGSYYYFDSIVVRQEKLALSLPDTLLCAGDSLILPYTAITDSFNNGNTFTLQLSDASGSFASGTTSLATVSGRGTGVFRTVVPTTLAPGSGYRLRMFSSSPSFSSRDNGRNISIGNARPSKPVASSNSAVCTADTLRLYASTSTTGFLGWYWTGPNNFNSTEQNPKVGLPSTGGATGDYIVTAYNYGCVARDTAIVNIKLAPSPLTISSGSPVCESDTLKLYSTTSSTGVTYSWTGPNSFTSLSQNPIVVNTQTAAAGKYYVTVTAANSCYRKDSTTVQVKTTPFVTASNNGPVCEAASIGLSAATSLTGAAFLWSGPNSYTASTQNSTINAITLGRPVPTSSRQRLMAVRIQA